MPLFTHKAVRENGSSITDETMPSLNGLGYVPAITMAPSMMIKNLTIETSYTGVIIAGANARICDCDFKYHGQAGYAAIALLGGSQNIAIENVNIEADAVGVYFNSPEGPIDIKNSRIKMTAGIGIGHAAIYGYPGENSQVKIFDSVISGTGNWGIDLRSGGSLDIQNVVVGEGLGGASLGVQVSTIRNAVLGYIHAGGGITHISNSSLTGDVVGNVQVANSKIMGTPATGVKTVGCYDANYDPIANGVH